MALLFWIYGQPESIQAQQRGSSAEDSISLTTRDGVRIKATYYPSSLGKNSVPVVMLHDFKQSRSVFNGLAQALSSPPNGDLPSHAVLTVDLRGHGESTVVEGRGGATRKLEITKFGKQDYRNMVLYDMEAVRKFLVRKNDAGELNLNKLCLLGTGMGANVAVSWAAVDWSTPKLASRKQGQDVKGLVLTSPEWSHRGLPLLKSIKHRDVREKLSMLIIYGEQDKKATKSAETIHKNVERYHPTPPPEAGLEEKDLVMVGLPTSLQGTRLLADPSFRTLPILEFFLDARLAQQDFEWIQRRRSN
ncbi:MAG: alpha/beta hydrolase [Bythopirellula sp.]